MTFVEFELTEEEKYDIISELFCCYFDTAQDTSEFAVEFYNLVGRIIHNQVPVKLDYLCDFLEVIVESLPKLKKNKTIREELECVQKII